MMSSKYHATSSLLVAFALVTLMLTTVAEAQPYGPGGMMGGDWGWGMGYGMGGFGGIAILALALAVLAIGDWRDGVPAPQPVSRIVHAVFRIT